MSRGRPSRFHAKYLGAITTGTLHPTSPAAAASKSQARDECDVS
jgi:hypothetical protein